VKYRPELAKSVRRATWITAMAAALLVAAMGVADWAHLGRRRVSPIRRAPTRPASLTPAMGPVQEQRRSVPTRILLGGGNPVGLPRVRALLEREGFEVVGDSRNRHELVDLALRLRPAVVVLDDDMTRASALAVAREIVSDCRETQVVLLTRHAAEPHIVSAFRAGVRGYVLKAETKPALARAIREVSRGQLFLSAGASRGLTAAYRPRAAIALRALP
jgi:CheY-like chemotaxis protein